VDRSAVPKIGATEMTAWKKKEKELTKEEAIEQARAANLPFWFGCSPKFVIYRAEGRKASVFPLDKDFDEFSWMITILNPSTFSGQKMISFTREMQKRYHVNNVKFLVVIPSFYTYLKDRTAIEAIIRRHQITCPVAVDPDYLICEAFDVKKLPAIAVVNKREVLYSHSGDGWNEKPEEELQKHLRSTDPGLALLPLFKEQSGELSADVHIMDLGRGRNVKYPEPGFKPLEDKPGTGYAEFKGDRPQVMKEGEFFIKGKWHQDGDRIFTRDKEAEIGFCCPHPGLSLVAQSMEKTYEMAKVVIDLDGAPAFEVFGSEDLTFDEEGQSCIKADTTRLYHAFKSIPPGKTQITLRFTAAERTSVGLHGIRIIR